MTSDKKYKSKVMRGKIKFTMLANVMQPMNTAKDTMMSFLLHRLF